MGHEMGMKCFLFLLLGEELEPFLEEQAHQETNHYKTDQARSGFDRPTVDSPVSSGQNGVHHGMIRLSFVLDFGAKVNPR